MKKTAADNLEELKSWEKEYKRWADLASSENGKFLTDYLQEAEDEVISQWCDLLTKKLDENDKYKDSLWFRFSSFRTKLQTIRALKRKLTEAEIKRYDIEKELAQLEMRQ